MASNEPLPINLPPGVWRNGTRYQAKGRWYETNRVRWHDGALRSIGGWAMRQYSGADYPAAPGVIRDQHGWRDNTKNRRHVIAGPTGIWEVTDTGAYTDIKPAGLPDGPIDITQFLGYGTGPYGVGPYGTARDADNVETTPVARWALDNWGQDLLAMPDWVTSTDPTPRTIYTWTPGGGSLTTLTNAPHDIEDFVVTDYRIVMAIGDGGELRKVRWSDQENNTDWTPTPSNQADERTLDGSGKLIGIYNVGKNVLILSESDAQVGRYVGPPYVYSFDRVGEDCAPSSRHVVAVTNEIAVWVGERNFWIFDGNTVRELPCDLIDYLANTASVNYNSKAFMWINGDYTEIWLHYVSNAAPGSDPNAYIMWNWTEGHWAHGFMDRTSLYGTAVLQNPVGFDHSSNQYWHEKSGVFVEDSYATTGPLELQEGGKNLAISRVWPDTQRFGDVSIQFDARQMPTGNVISSPTYTYANPTNVKVLGRDVMMRVTGQNTGWEFGVPRLEYMPIGTGRR